MKRGLWSCIFCLILLSPAVNARADTAGASTPGTETLSLSSDGSGLALNSESAGPYRNRNRDYDERSFRGGFEGRTMLRIHAGFSSPTGDFSDAVDMGWGLGASIGYGVGRNTVLSWGIAYHRFGEDFGNPDFDGHVGITPITMSVDYGFSTRGKVRPWISGGIGLYHLSEHIEEFVPPSTTIETSDSENDFGFNFGFGIATPLSERTVFGAGFKFHHIAGDEFPDTDFIAIQAGLAYPL